MPFEDLDDDLKCHVCEREEPLNPETCTRCGHAVCRVHIEGGLCATCRTEFDKKVSDGS